jgi:hypothetical protein
MDPQTLHTIILLAYLFKMSTRVYSKPLSPSFSTISTLIIHVTFVYLVGLSFPPVFFRFVAFVFLSLSFAAFHFFVRVGVVLAGEGVSAKNYVPCHSRCGTII